MLGIPHPPGTPLFVMMAHVWAHLVPIGEFAVRTNLLSALMSALGAGASSSWSASPSAGSSRGSKPRSAGVLRNGGALAAALIGAFTFTNWQNSNETEVYAVATFTIAAICWLCFVWRARRGTPAGDRILLLIVYLGGISVANHLLALLVGPARRGVHRVDTPRSAGGAPGGPAARMGPGRDRGRCLGASGGEQPGSSGLTLLGAVCFAAAAAYALPARAGGFALLALVVAAIGLTPYLYLFLRSARHPVLNEAAPHTWDAGGVPGSVQVLLRRRLEAERARKPLLKYGVRAVVGTADDVRDLEVVVVDDTRQVIRRAAVRPEERRAPEANRAVGVEAPRPRRRLRDAVRLGRSAEPGRRSR